MGSRLSLLFFIGFLATGRAASTIDPVNRFAYGANLGWINFENAGAPRVDLSTGRMAGFAWSANCGWSSLSNAVAVV
jgi:hypothetical protein